jgi:RNA polymerase sigma-70 factor (ECF subfamily)
MMRAEQPVSSLPQQRAGHASSGPAELEAVFRASFLPLVKALALVCDDPADIVQDAFVEACRRWDAVGGYEDPAGWIRHVAVNRARDRWRRRSVEGRSLGRLFGRGPAEPGGVDAAIDVRAAVRRLPPRQRLAVVLYYVADLSVADVAVSMAVSEGAVKAALYAGRKRLARELGDADDE